MKESTDQSAANKRAQPSIILFKYAKFVYQNLMRSIFTAALAIGE
jgi:hypothetical protein